ncbi:MAG: hypothetical protein FWF56_00275 [Firmicutes bacterium]|nr:hypothetical protein [Bacillota bacterium]MCL1953534.1 hypothetical protein [Bacillota bacterium]
MTRGVKVLIFGAVVLAFSSVLGFLSVLYVFDTLSDGGYYIESMKIDNINVDVEQPEYDSMYDRLSHFEIRGRQIDFVDGDILGGLKAHHRLRGGFIDDKFVEFSGVMGSQGGDDWLRLDGSENSFYERVIVKNGKVHWTVQEPNKPKLLWIYSKS